MRLLLASKSEARRRMLENAGVPFEAVAAPFEEEQAKAGLLASGFEPRDLAEMLAELKAKSVAAAPGDLVLGADQVLELDDGGMLNKPVSRHDASAQLRRLSGATHKLHSAAVVVAAGERLWGTTETVMLEMRMLGDAFLQRYLDAEYEAIRWSVGGYRIEGPGAQLFSRIEGSHFAILGLPLLPLLAFLREQGVLELNPSPARLVGVSYAEVIGDPIGHSKSPLIHEFWLAKLGIDGDYRATRVTSGRAAGLSRCPPRRSGLARLQCYDAAQAGGLAIAR